MLPSIPLHNAIPEKNLVGEDPTLWLKTLYFLRVVMQDVRLSLMHESERRLAGKKSLNTTP